MLFEIGSSLLVIFLILVLFTYISSWGNGPATDLTHSMKDKIIVITGGSRGIGLETAKDLLRQGATVIICCRDKVQANEAINTIQNQSHKSKCIYINLDLTDYENIKSFVEEIKKNYGKIDILINNAGSCF